jgi:hypothetical protein
MRSSKKRCTSYLNSPSSTGALKKLCLTLRVSRPDSDLLRQQKELFTETSKLPSTRAQCRSQSLQTRLCSCTEVSKNNELLCCATHTSAILRATCRPTLCDRNYSSVSWHLLQRGQSIFRRSLHKIIPSTTSYPVLSTIADLNGVLCPSSPKYLSKRLPPNE